MELRGRGDSIRFWSFGQSPTASAAKMARLVVEGPCARGCCCCCCLLLLAAAAAAAAAANSEVHWTTHCGEANGFAAKTVWKRFNNMVLSRTP